MFSPTLLSAMLENKKIYLHQVSPECKQLIEKADNIVEVTTIDDVNWHIATDKLA